jgi:hypothetical protein
MAKVNKVATKEKPLKKIDKMRKSKADNEGVIKALPKPKTPQASKKGTNKSSEQEHPIPVDVKEDDKNIDKEKQRQDSINSVVRLAYCLEMEFPSSSLLFIEKLMGIKGGKKEPEIDNNKALTKDSQLYAEIIKVMSDPEVSFKEKFSKAHNWEENFRVESVGTQRKMYNTFYIDPDFIWEHPDPVKKKRKMKELWELVKKDYCTVKANFEKSGSDGDIDEWSFRCPDKFQLLHGGVIALKLYGKSLSTSRINK